MRVIFGLCLTSFLLAQSPRDLKSGFLKPPDDARIMMRWWWFGPSVTEAQLAREMNTMKQGGIGGFEVQPTYPLAMDDPSKGIRNLTFLSPEFMSRLRFTSEEARRLGLRMDLTLGSGWPFGGPQIPVTQAAGRLRIDKVAVRGDRLPLPDLANGEQIVAAFDSASHRELTNIREGFLYPEASTKEVSFFIASRTGMMVKRPSVGAEGFVLDHYDPAATQNYLKSVGEPLLKALPIKPTAIFCDSLEVFGSDWTPGFLAEFQKRRGYDLRPHLPALASDLGPKTAGIRHDWGKTLTELLDEKFLAPMQKWTKANGVAFRMQNYGIPPATLSSHAYVDLPEGEGAQWKVVRASRWASSASHIYGRAATSSETWTWLHSPVFRATPLDMKAEADIHFIQGINQLIGHGWPYTSEGVEYPGWRFYAAAVFNDKNPWYIAMPDISKYLQRVSYVLRQGQPANDVALYLPTADAWSHFSAGRVHMIEQLRELVGPDVIPQVLNAGYGFDFFDDAILADLGKVDGKTLALGAARYNAVVVPAVDIMPVATLKRLDEFARAGGVVVFLGRQPTKAPGFQATDAEHAEVQRLVKAMKTFPNLRAGLTPDIAIQPAHPEVGFIHRKSGTTDVYFLANTANTPARFTATFRANGKSVEAWDAVSGRITPLPSGKNALAIELEPYESRLIVFSDTPSAAPARPQVAGPGSEVDLSTEWKVAYGPSSTPQTMATLQLWSKPFSGVTTYTKSFDAPAGTSFVLDFGKGTPVALPARMPANGMQTWFDAPVREAAVVYVNGQRAGSVWCPPYRLDVSAFVKPGRNELKVEVGNLAINHMAARPLPNYRLLNLRYGSRFDPQDMNKIQIEPAGLQGPVKLLVNRGERLPESAASARPQPAR